MKKLTDRQRLIEYYKEFCEIGIMSHFAGLCSFFENNFAQDGKISTSFRRFTPTTDEKLSLIIDEGKNSVFWASDNKGDELTEFTNLRATIMAFVIAMTEE